MTRLFSTPISDRHRLPRTPRVRPESERVGRSGRRPSQRPYVVVDGEAIEGQYRLLSAYNGSSFAQLDSPTVLGTQACLDFLLAQGTELWGFAVGYDVNHWLADLSEDHLRRLQRTQRCYWGPYKLHYIPNKCFRVWRRKRLVGCDGWFPDGYCTVWDAYSFVGASFVSWIRSWDLVSGLSAGDRTWLPGLHDEIAPAEGWPAALTQDEMIYAFLSSMKDARSSFSSSMGALIQHYNRLELELLHIGVGRLKRLAAECGYRPGAWYSPGSLASAALRQHRIPEYRLVGGHPVEVRAALQSAYYGGRFELSHIGFLPGPLYAYDIRSAYPAAMLGLPSLAGGVWRHLVGGPELAGLDYGSPDVYALLRVDWDPLDREQAWGPLPMRHKGFVRYPLSSRHGSWYSRAEPHHGWYWGWEVAAAETLAYIRVHEAWRFIPSDSSRPFAWVEELYQQRARLKAASNPQEYVLKLVINSLYGKLAQRPYRGGDPPYRDLLWAGLITARTRATLLRAIAQGPVRDNPVFMLATDALYSRVPLDLPLGSDLGQWEEDLLAWVVLVQCGVYYFKRVGRTGLVERRRGLERGRPYSLAERRTRSLHRAVYDYWQRGAALPEMQGTRFVGFAQALDWGMLDLWRTWQPYTKRLDMTTEPKRLLLPRTGSVQGSRARQRVDEAGLLDLDNMTLFVDEFNREGGGWQEPDHDTQLAYDQPDGEG